LAEEALTLAVADARAALALVEEGREPLLRGIQAESEAAAARASLDEAKAERDAAFARLSAVAMLPTPATSIEAGLLDAPTTPSARSETRGADRAGRRGRGARRPSAASTSSASTAALTSPPASA
jgi:cobalt-zinc-cadmium efflux system outer membrane protein